MDQKFAPDSAVTIKVRTEILCNQNLNEDRAHLVGEEDSGEHGIWSDGLPKNECDQKNAAENHRDDNVGRTPGTSIVRG
jgi:hypothetical protein